MNVPVPFYKKKLQITLMNTKTSTLLAVSIAAILTLSVVAVGEIPQALADKNEYKNDYDHGDSKKSKFHKKPSFVSESCIITPFAEDFLPQESLNALDCKMTAWLDKKGNALKYRIEIAGMELIDSNTDHHTPDGALDDIDGMHIHKMTNDDFLNPKGPHQLNVFGNPGFDDFDVVVRPAQGIVKGIWSDGDENTSYGEPDNTHTLTENLELLCEGKVFSAVHGEIEDRPDHKAPYVKMVLEPTKQGNKICDKLGY